MPVIRQGRLCLHGKYRRVWKRLALALVVTWMGAASSWAAAQTTPQATVTVTPAAIPWSDPEIVNPLRGFYRWYGIERIPQPRPSYDHYRRYSWRELEPAKGVYDFSPIERDLQAAQAAGAKFAFRVMSANGFSAPVEVPEYLRQEAGGTSCAYQGQAMWVPNWEHPQFLPRAQALIQALGARFNGEPRLAYYDMGLYGYWGEWVIDAGCPMVASAATKRALVDMQVAAFPATRILMNSGGKEVDAFVYALSKSSSIGIRVDNLCDVWFDQQFIEHPAKLAAMQHRWQTAPIVAEHTGGGHPSLLECDRQIRAWHVVAVASGNFDDWANYSSTEQSQLLLVGKRSGYRFQLNALTYPSAVTTGQRFTIESRWSNVGVTPLYEQFAVMFELRSQATQARIWAGVSRLDLQRFLPTTQPLPVSDDLMIPAWIPAGQYNLNLIVRDPTGYRPPLTLANTGKDSSTRYPLGTIAVTSGAPGHTVYLPRLTR